MKINQKTICALFVLSFLFLTSCGKVECGDKMDIDSVAYFEFQMLDRDLPSEDKEEITSKLIDFGYKFISTVNTGGTSWDRFTIICGSGLVEQRRFFQIGSVDGKVTELNTDISR